METTSRPKPSPTSSSSSLPPESQDRPQELPEIREHHRPLQELPGKLLAGPRPGRVRPDHQGGRAPSAGRSWPEDALAGYSEFLGYFMPRKVMCGREKRCSGRHGHEEACEVAGRKRYIEDTRDDQERAGEAARELPTPGKVADLLDAYVDETAPAQHERRIEDHFWIEKIEPGKLC